MNHDRLFHLKESLVKFVEAIQKNQADADKPLPKDDKDDTGLGSIKKIVDECHELRTSLSEELGAREDIGSQNQTQTRKYQQNKVARDIGTADYLNRQISINGN